MVNRIYIKIILLLVILISYFWLIYTAFSLDCNKCIMTLKTTEKAATIGNFSDIVYTAEELFNESQGGKICPVIWDRVQGYVGI